MNKDSVSTYITVETNRQLEKAASSAGMSVEDAVRFIINNGPDAFFRLIGGVHQA